MDASRWLVVDTETSGLDPQRDRLIAIAAVAVRVDWPARRLAVDPADSFEVVLRYGEEAFEPANILLHGIGMRRQSEGVGPARALQAFADFAGTSPLLAFHADFDRAVVQRLARRHGVRLAQPWLDIEQLCSATLDGQRGSLDDWLDRFGIDCRHRHQPAADALAASELLLRIWRRVAAECRSWNEVRKLAASGRWMARSRPIPPGAGRRLPPAHSSK